MVDGRAHHRRPVHLGAVNFIAVRSTGLRRLRQRSDEAAERDQEARDPHPRADRLQVGWPRVECRVRENRADDHRLRKACASATPATVTEKSDVLVRCRKGASCSVGSASGAAEKPKMTRKTPSISVSPPTTRDLGELRCCTRCMQKIVTRPISVGGVLGAAEGEGIVVGLRDEDVPREDAADALKVEDEEGEAVAVVWLRHSVRHGGGGAGSAIARVSFERVGDGHIDRPGLCRGVVVGQYCVRARRLGRLLLHRPSDSSLCRWPSGGFSFSVLLALASLLKYHRRASSCLHHVHGVCWDGTGRVARGSPWHKQRVAVRKKI
eukprot:scaffold25237_cov63-Phaeocystis_antarctica.AAC.1